MLHRWCSDGRFTCSGRVRAARGARACLLAGVLLVPPASVTEAQEAESRVLPAAAGGLVGVVGGGYIALAIIVAESRSGRFIHDLDDVLSWRSAPVVAGAITGAGLGVYSPPLLEAAVVYGALGMGVGALAGMALGSAFWDPPEGRWAGAAIGAGVGLVAGNVAGILYPFRSENDGSGSPLPLLMVRFPTR